MWQGAQAPNCWSACCRELLLAANYSSVADAVTGRKCWSCTSVLVTYQYHSNPFTTSICLRNKPTKKRSPSRWRYARCTHQRAFQGAQMCSMFLKSMLVHLGECCSIRTRFSKQLKVRHNRVSHSLCSLSAPCHRILHHRWLGENLKVAKASKHWPSDIRRLPVAKVLS